MTNKLIEAADELCKHVDEQLMYMDLCDDKGDLGRNMHRALTAYRAARESAGEVEVKPLVWDCRGYLETAEDASSILGDWVVWTANGDSYYKGPGDHIGTCIPSTSGCKAAAKAAAQADYARRIRSAIAGG